MRQLETDGGLGGQYDVFVSGEGSAPGTCASASRQSDRSTFASASQAADDAAQSRTSPGHHRSTLAFALRRKSL
jgi:hypothetical protein